MSNDYIPQKDGDFNQFFKYLNQYVNLKCTGTPPAWTHIPAPARTALQDEYALWYTAYSNTLTPHSKVETEAKNDAKKAAERAIRPFVNQYLRYPPVTNEDRTAMGIHNKDTVPSNIPVPPTHPVYNIAVKDIRRLDVHFQDQGTESKAKPYGYHGAVIYWEVSDTPPARPEDLSQSTLATRTPYTLEFEEPQRGKKVYIALRWQNEKGEKGPWSEMQQAVIP